MALTSVYVCMPSQSLDRVIANLELSVTRCNYRRTHIIRADYFRSIDTDEKAYWLGLLYADGNLSSCNDRSWHISLALAQEDGYMVERLRDTLNPSKTIPVTLVKRSLEKSTYQDQRKLCIYSNVMALDLIRKNVVPNKSLVLEFPTDEQVPARFLGSFIRGYFDGDGSFIQPATGRLYAKIVGSHPFINGLWKALERLGIPSRRYEVNEGRNLTIQIHALKEVLALASLMYGSDGPFLTRKRKLFHDWCDRLIFDCQSPNVFKPDMSRQPNGKIRVRFSFDGKRTCLGVYRTETEAHEVFCAHAERFIRSISCTNLEKLKLLSSLRIKRPTTL
jgi:hypothetical protein